MVLGIPTHCDQHWAIQQLRFGWELQAELNPSITLTPNLGKLQDTAAGCAAYALRYLHAPFNREMGFPSHPAVVKAL